MSRSLQGKTRRLAYLYHVQYHDPKTADQLPLTNPTVYLHYIQSVLAWELEKKKKKRKILKHPSLVMVKQANWADTMWSKAWSLNQTLSTHTYYMLGLTISTTLLLLFFEKWLRTEPEYSFWICTWWLHKMLTRCTYACCSIARIRWIQP